LKRILSSAHDVSAVTSARDALELLLEDAEYDVILCDLMMPEMSGMDLYAELARRTPALAGRMIFMTGGAFTNRARDFLERIDNQRIEKPIDADGLRALIRGFIP
jgi:CheY-like chemotaxis protein